MILSRSNAESKINRVYAPRFGANETMRESGRERFSLGIAPSSFLRSLFDQTQNALTPFGQFEYSQVVLEESAICIVFVPAMRGAETRPDQTKKLQGGTIFNAA
jgi:hypothetical protein